MYYVYILESEKDVSFYIGQTDNVTKRLTDHNNGRNKSTRSKVPWKLLYTKEYETRSDAYSTEQYLKKKKKRASVLLWIENQKEAGNHA